MSTAFMPYKKLIKIDSVFDSSIRTYAPEKEVSALREFLTDEKKHVLVEFIKNNPYTSIELTKNKLYFIGNEGDKEHIKSVLNATAKLAEDLS